MVMLTAERTQAFRCERVREGQKGFQDRNIKPEVLRLATQVLNKIITTKKTIYIISLLNRYPSRAEVAPSFKKADETSLKGQQIRAVQGKN